MRPVPAQFHGLLLRRTGGALPALCHWVRVPLANGQLYRLTGTDDLPAGDALEQFATTLCEPLPDAAEWVEMEDPARGVLRRAALANGVLVACLLLARDLASLPRPDAIAPLLGATIPDSERWRVLVGGQTGPVADTGPRVCACFGVGRATICRAVLEHGLRTTHEVGTRLSAGTNCGSCLPELQAILRELGSHAVTGTGIAPTSLALAEHSNG